MAWVDVDAGKALTKLSDSQTGLGNSSGPSVQGQQKVYVSWGRRVKAITGLCDGLVDVLEKTGHDVLKTDDAIKAAIDKLNVPPAGSGKGQ